MQGQQLRQDNRAQDYQDWLSISNANGWIIFEKELKELISQYERYMDNVEASGDMLKSYQLVKKGLKLALDIPRVLENKMKLARKEINGTRLT